ncbi:MAG: glycoside hydrolase family 88 protein [Oscillospiraceae bacterium]|nr:glycoside hydrolase family 88 protein [Oscillospiraceae bacterium]
MLDIVNKELQGAVEKVNKNMPIYGNKLPNVSATLKFSERLSDDGDWTGSFWTGMVILAGVVTGETYSVEDKYRDYLDSFYGIYERRLKTGWKDHDLGFLYTLYAMNAYRITNDQKYMDMTIAAAKALMCRYNPKGGYIRAWNLLIRPERREKLIIDCLMNLPLLFCVAKVTGNEYMSKAAENHARATLNNIREDGSTYHTFDFDYVTGKPLKGESEGAFDDTSCWSRGQGWGIYGYTLAYLHTLDKEFLQAATKIADHFISKLDERKVPAWDFAIKAANEDAVDTSAGAIAASGLYDLALCVDEEKAEFYRKTADDILLALIKNHSHTFDENSEALLDCANCGLTHKDGKIFVNQWASIFGDYYYMEALVKRSGLHVNMWDL